jgi:hypothetical protein
MPRRVTLELASSSLIETIQGAVTGGSYEKVARDSHLNGGCSRRFVSGRRHARTECRITGSDSILGKAG